MKLPLLVVVLGLLTGNAYAGSAERVVVVYVSQDQVYSEPVLKDFEAATGIKVKAIYDVEAAKTVGLVNRIIAEKNNPQADVFWNSELCRTLVLKKKGMLTPYVSPSAADIPVSLKDKDNFWTAFGGRGRVMVYNTKLVAAANAPKSIFDLANPQWKGKVCMANPLFGTSSTHAAALYASLGKDKLRKLFSDLKTNGILVVDGNAPALERVVEGLSAVGYTDTDDAVVAIKDGKPVAMVFPDKDGMGTLMMPNSVALVKNAPHSENAKKLIDYLLNPQVESRLLANGAIQIACRPSVKIPADSPDTHDLKPMDVDYDKICDSIEASARIVKETLLK